MMTININGKSFDSFEEVCKVMFQDAATDPEYETLYFSRY